MLHSISSQWKNKIKGQQKYHSEYRLQMHKLLENCHKIRNKIVAELLIIRANLFGRTLNPIHLKSKFISHDRVENNNYNSLMVSISQHLWIWSEWNRVDDIFDDVNELSSETSIFCFLDIEGKFWRRFIGLPQINLNFTIRDTLYFRHPVFTNRYLTDFFLHFSCNTLLLSCVCLFFEYAMSMCLSSSQTYATY